MVWLVLRKSSRPIWCFFLCHFPILVSFIYSFFPDLCASQAEEVAEDEAEVGNSYLLQLLRPNPRRAHRGKFLVGLERPTSHFWARNRVQKWGRSSPTRCFARVQIDRRASRNLVFVGHLRDRQGDREGDGYGDLSLSCTHHPPASQWQSGLFEIVIPTSVRGLENEKAQ